MSPDYAKDPRIDQYIDGLPDWQQAICRDVRDLVHEADPDVVETIKRRDRPYFVLEGNVCALLGTKDHVDVFLYDGAIVPDPEGIITGGHDNKAARMIAIGRDGQINRPALLAMFRQIIANNRAGGWRRLKAEAWKASSPSDAGADQRANPCRVRRSLSDTGAGHRTGPPVPDTSGGDQPGGTPNASASASRNRT